MDIDLGSFGVGQVVVHEVPAGEQDEAVLSETVDDPGDEPKQFFQRRVVDSLTNAGRRVRFRPAGDDNKSPVPKAIRDLLFERTELLPMSQQCALHLATCQQSGAVSPGLLCVIEGSVDDKRAVGVVKLEMEEGVQLTRKRVEGKRSLTIKSVKELMMSERTRVFKVGVFWPSGQTVRGIVSDHQMSRTSVRGVADFFLHGFLGAELEELPEVTTARFFETAQGFIVRVPDPEKQYRYDGALHAELLSSTPSIHPSKFARTHIDKEDRPAFLKAVAEKEIPPEGFNKNTIRIDALIRKRRLGFTSGLQLAGPVAGFEKHVVAESDRVIINDSIARVGHKL